MLSRGHVRQYLESGNGNRLINGYGQRETTTLACCYGMRSFYESRRSVPIGGPIGNTRVYIVDGGLEAVGVGVSGEICVGGLGVSRGYGKGPELTGERFVPDPFAREWGARMYRTGDVGRWGKEGKIEFVGRRDEQVRIRGYRIELGEIEERLLQHRRVGEAVVVAREDEAGDQRLIAYYTVKAEEGEGEAEGAEVRAEELRDYLSRSLPEYMVPWAYVRLEKLPLTANGKVDRKGLPGPEEEAYAVRGYEAPEGEMETIVAQILERSAAGGTSGEAGQLFRTGRPFAAGGAGDRAVAAGCGSGSRD